MKTQRHYLLISSVIIGLFFFGCTDMSDVGLGPQPGHNAVSDDWEAADPAPSGIDIPVGALTVREACDSCRRLGNGGTTKKMVYVKGYVRSLDDKHADGVRSYGNATFYLSDQKSKRGDLSVFEAYQVYGYRGMKMFNEDEVKVGDYVVLKCYMTNYNGTFETTGKGEGYIYRTTNELSLSRGQFLDGITYEQGELSVSAADSTFRVNRSKDEYKIRGGVIDVKYINFLETKKATFTISDGETSLVCSDLLLDESGNGFVNGRQVRIGDVLTVVGKRTVLEGSPAVYSGYILRSTNTDEGLEDEIVEISPTDAYSIVNAADMRPNTATDRAYAVKGVFRGYQIGDVINMPSSLTLSIYDDNDVEFKAYSVYYGGFRNWTTEDPYINAGDTLIITSPLQLYQGSSGSIVETCSNSGAWISGHIKPTSEIGTAVDAEIGTAVDE